MVKTSFFRNMLDMMRICQLGGRRKSSDGPDWTQPWMETNWGREGDRWFISDWDMGDNATKI